MSHKPPRISAALYNYAASQSLAEHTLLQQLRAETLRLPSSQMISSLEQVQFIQLLIRLMKASRVIEIGTFTGYTSLAMAMALPDDGFVLSCDRDPDCLKIAESYWRQAGMSDRITARLMPALDLLDELAADPQFIPFDVAYIDADKKNNRHYYEKLLTLVRQGGLIITDNVLWKAKVIDDSCQDSQTQSIREFNTFVAQDDRVESVMLLLGDGLSLARKL